MWAQRANTEPFLLRMFAVLWKTALVGLLGLSIISALEHFSQIALDDQQLTLSDFSLEAVGVLAIATAASFALYWVLWGIWNVVFAKKETYIATSARLVVAIGSSVSSFLPQQFVTFSLTRPAEDLCSFTLSGQSLDGEDFDSVVFNRVPHANELEVIITDILIPEQSDKTLQS